MASVSKEIAEKKIESLKKQKKPKVYGVFRYQNRLLGDSEKGTYSGYAICYRKNDYDSLMTSIVVGGVDVLWASERLKADEAQAARDEEMAELASMISPQLTVEGYIANHIHEVYSGFTSEYRRKGRRAGLTSIQATISIKEFRKRLRDRIVGRCKLDQRAVIVSGDPVLIALSRTKVPSCAELWKKWLPDLFAESKGVSITKDTLEFTVVVPPPRKAFSP